MTQPNISNHVTQCHTTSQDINYRGKVFSPRHANSIPPHPMPQQSTTFQTIANHGKTNHCTTLHANAYHDPQPHTTAQQPIGAKKFFITSRDCTSKHEISQHSKACHKTTKHTTPPHATKQQLSGPKSFLATAKHRNSRNRKICHVTAFHDTTPKPTTRPRTPMHIIAQHDT